MRARDQPNTLSTHSTIEMLFPRTTTIPISFFSVLLPGTFSAHQTGLSNLPNRALQLGVA